MVEYLQGSSSRESYVYIGLSVAQQAVRQRHPTLCLALPARPSLPELLEACSKALSSDTLPITVPAVPNASEARRQALRNLALACLQGQETPAAKRAAFPGRNILTHGLLESACPPRPLTSEQRARLKESLADVLHPRQPGPNPHLLMLHPLLESGLSAVTCNITISAIDHEEQMPQETISKESALWDTGSEVTLITDDLMSKESRDFVQKAGVHDPYRHEGAVRVRIVCTVEFSNALLQIETIATVLPLVSAPNGRSGVTLGQRGVIDSLRYESVPRNIAVAEDPTLPEDCWGRFDLKCYYAAYGEVQYF